MAQRSHQAHESDAAHSAQALPSIPDKLYFRIGEAAELCGVPSYVLRFWESEFPQLKPNKGGGGQRLYRRRDLDVVCRIKTLLYIQGMTIPGARQALKVEQRGTEPQLTLLIVDGDEGQTPERKSLRRLRGELRELVDLLSTEPRPTPARLVRLSRVPGLTSPTPGTLFD